MENYPEKLQPIMIAAGCAAIALALLIVSTECFCRDRKAAKKEYERYVASEGIDGGAEFVSDPAQPLTM